MAANKIQLKIVKRTGDVVEFDDERVKIAIGKAVNSVGAKVSQELMDNLVDDISLEVQERFVEFFPNVENIQDIVEKHLVKKGLYEIAKKYILYRAERQRIREEKKESDIQKAHLGRLTVKKRDGRTTLLDAKKINETLSRASVGFDGISTELITQEAIKNIYDGIFTEGVERSLILSSVSFIERDPDYSYVAARIFLQKLYKEVMGRSISKDLLSMAYREAFIQGIKKGVANNILDKRLLDFDLSKLAYTLKIERDSLFEYMGIQTLYERYFAQIDKRRIELPQAFWMRVAMGLSVNEEKKEEKTLEFYEIMSTMHYLPSTPTLFNAGTTRPQLSSCCKSLLTFQASSPSSY